LRKKGRAPITVNAGEKRIEITSLSDFFCFTYWNKVKPQKEPPSKQSPSASSGRTQASSPVRMNVRGRYQYSSVFMNRMRHRKIAAKMGKTRT